MQERDKFPIVPQFIGTFKKKGQIYEENDINNSGVFGPSTILGNLAITAHNPDINSPTTLFQFIEGNVLQGSDLGHYIVQKNIHPFFENKNCLNTRKIVRISNNEFSKYEECCANFKKKVAICSKKSNTNTDCSENSDFNSKYCEIIDSRVAFFAKQSLRKNNIQKDLQKDIDAFNKVSSSPTVQLLRLNDKERVYIHYLCPYSLINIVLVPIFFEERIIGCLMAANTPYLKENEISNFYHKNSIIKEYYLTQKEFIEHRMNSNPEIQDELDLTKCVKSLVESAKNFEIKLSKRVAMHRYRFIYKEVNQLKKYFSIESHKTLNNFNQETAIEDIAIVINKTFTKANETFCNKSGFIRVFAVTDFSSPYKLELIASTDNLEKAEQNKYYYSVNNITENIKKLNITISNTPQDKLKYPNLNLDSLKENIYYDKLQINLNHNKDIVRYYPTFSDKLSFVFWKNYSFPEELSAAQSEIYTEAFIDLYSHISSLYSTLWGLLKEKELEMAVRVAGHQASQITPGIQNMLSRDFNSTESVLLMLKNGTLNKKIFDLKNNFELLNFYQTRPGTLFKEIKNKERSEVDLTSLILNLKNAFQSELKLHYKQLILNNNKPTKVKVVANIFEHVLFNLIDNAVKYSYRGTKINVSIKEDSKWVTLHVISYGFGIDNRNIVFKLYGRSRSTDKVGEGIGMYISKKIMEAHNGSIDFNSMLINKFHVGCLAMVYSGTIDKIAVNASTLERDAILNNANYYRKTFINEVSATGKFGEILFDPGPTTFMSDYNNKTFKNDFFIKLPKENIYENINT